MRKVRIHRVEEEGLIIIPSNKRSKKTSANNKLLAAASYIITILLVVGMFYEGASITSSTSTLAQGTLTTPELVLTALFSLFLSFIVLSYMFIKGNTWKEIIDSLGLSKSKLSLRMLSYGVMIFAVIFLLEVVLTLVAQVSGIQISTNTQLVLGGAPIWFLLFVVFITPINEEIFFRGFLIKGIAHVIAVITGTRQNFDSNNAAAWSGIVISAMLFGLSHASYDSTFGVDMLAAGIFAILAGYVFRRTKSLYPSMLAHMLVNLLALIAFIA